MSVADEVITADYTETPGYVEHIPYSEVPVPADELGWSRRFVNALLDEVQQTQKMQALYLVHPLRIQQDMWREQNQKFAVCWEWETGQSVRLVELAQPEQKNQSHKVLENLAKIFPDEMGSMPRGPKPFRNLNAEVSHLLEKNEDFDRFFPQRRWFSPVEVFLGSGACSVFLVRNKEAFHRLAKALTVLKADATLGALDFAVPFFTLQDFSTASREEIENWMQLFELYIAEDTEQPGLVVASRHDLSSSITRIRKLLDQQP